MKLLSLFVIGIGIFQQGVFSSQTEAENTVEENDPKGEDNKLPVSYEEDMAQESDGDSESERDPPKDENELDEPADANDLEAIEEKDPWGQAILNGIKKYC